VSRLVVVDVASGCPLQGEPSPELAEAAAAEDGLQFACESLGVWQLVECEPHVLAAHRKLGRAVQLVAVKRVVADRSVA
jgi:hypothetical protein